MTDVVWNISDTANVELISIEGSHEMANEQNFGAGASSAAISPKERFGQEFDQAKDQIAGAASPAGSAVSDDLANVRDDILRLSDTVTRLAKQVGSDVASVAGAGAEAAKEQFASLTAGAEKVARGYPLTAIAGVFFAGLFIGMLRSR
jgi:hypothetical protein